MKKVYPKPLTTGLSGASVRRAAMTLLLAVLTTLTAWADPTIYIEPNYAGSVEVKNGQIYVTTNSGWNLVSVTWYENDPHGEISSSSRPCSDSNMGYYYPPYRQYSVDGNPSNPLEIQSGVAAHT
jgi:hypothetical protein